MFTAFVISYPFSNFSYTGELLYNVSNAGSCDDYFYAKFAYYMDAYNTIRLVFVIFPNLGVINATRPRRTVLLILTKTGIHKGRRSVSHKLCITRLYILVTSTDALTPERMHNINSYA